jgi:hypothetical protein
MTARRHHYVPRCYLRGFAVARKKGKHQVLVYDRKQRKVFPSAIENIAAERDFNRVEIEGMAPDALEASFGEFEGALTPALERTIASAAFQNDDDRAYVLNLVGLLALRNPRWRESMRQFREQIAKRMMDLTLASRERWESQHRAALRDGFLDDVSDISYEEAKKFHEEGAYKIEVSNETHIRQELKGFEAILPFLWDRKWAFLTAPRVSAGFITCDHPVVLTWSNPKQRKGFYSPGFGLKGTDVMFPLSSRLAMIGAFEIENRTFELSEDGVAGFNGAAVATAVRQVYARDHNFLYSLSRQEPPRKASRLIDDPQFLRRRAKTTRDGVIPETENELE